MTQTRVEHGAAGVWVSNHGGRQLDRAIASLDALGPIVDAVGGARGGLPRQGRPRRGRCGHRPGDRAPGPCSSGGRSSMRSRSAASLAWCRGRPPATVETKRRWRSLARRRSPTSDGSTSRPVESFVRRNGLLWRLTWNRWTPFDERRGLRRRRTRIRSDRGPNWLRWPISPSNGSHVIHPVAVEGRSGSKSRGQPSFQTVDGDRQAVGGRDRVLVGDDLASGPTATIAPWRSTRACPKPGGISSTWCDTRTMATGFGSAARSARSLEEGFAGAQVQAGRRLVQEQQVRLRHQRAGDRGPPPLAGRQRAERVIHDRLEPEPDRQVVGPGSIGVGVVVPPGFRGGMAGGHDQIERREGRHGTIPRPHSPRVRSGGDGRARRSGRSARPGSRPARSWATGSCRRPTGGWTCPSRWHPSTTHRSPGATAQSSGPRIVRPDRRTLTSARR